MTGVGCASAVPAAATRGPGRCAIVRESERSSIGVECVSGLHDTRAAGDERTKVVGSALFGDGCGAALLDHGRSDDGGPGDRRQRRASAARTRSTRCASRSTEADSYMRLGRELPLIAETGLPALVDESPRGRTGSTARHIDHWLLHPGGRGILEGATVRPRALGRAGGRERGVLAEYGNVGTASSFFVLRQLPRRCAVRRTGRVRAAGIDRPGRDRRNDVVELVRRRWR